MADQLETLLHDFYDNNFKEEGLNRSTGLLDQGEESSHKDEELSQCILTESCYIVNASSFLGPLDFVQPVYGYIMPVLSLITICSNVLIIIVLSRPKMTSPTNTILLALALCDLLTIILPAPWFIYTFTLNNHNSMKWTESLCYLYEFFLETAPQLFHNASIWLTLALAVQRYIYICQASQARHLCTISRARAVVVVVIVSSFIHMAPRMVDRLYIIEKGVNDEPICVVQFASWIRSISQSIYFGLFFWLRVFLVHLIPCLLLMVFNGLLLAGVAEAEQKRSNLVVARARRRGSQRRHKQREKMKRRDSFRITVMSVIVISIFLVTEIPLMFITMLHALSTKTNPLLDYDIANNIVLIINTFMCLSCPLNLIVYCSMSKVFRKTFTTVVSHPFCTVDLSLLPPINSRSTETRL